MKPISTRYENIFSKYYFDKAEARFQGLMSYTKKYLNNIDFKERFNTGIDPIKADAFIVSYFLDVIRFKDYHFNSNGDDLKGGHLDKFIHTEKLISASKVGAFTAKWLLRYSPFYAVPKYGALLNNDEQRFLAFAPFAHAINFSLRSMGIRPRSVPRDIYEQMLYHVRFRGFDDRSFIMYNDLLIRHLKERENQ